MAKVLKVPVKGGKLKYNLPLFLSPTFIPAVVDRHAISIYFGGAGSGKSVTVARRTILDLTMGQRNFLIVRKVYGTLLDSFYMELLCAISDLGLESEFSWTKSPLAITHNRTGKSVLFRGMDNKEKVKSIRAKKGVITDIIFEEATEFTEEDFDMLETRLRGLSEVPKRITILFNPIFKEHWIYERFFAGRFGDDDREIVYSQPVEYVEYDDFGEPHKVKFDRTIKIHKSTHRDNKFLLQEDHARYEAFKDTNPYYHDVYCNGNWGVLGDRIFANFRVADLSNVEQGARKKYYGMDYGWNPDPFACVSVAIVGRKICILREVGGYEAHTRAIASSIKPMVGDNKVICDNSENRTTSELKLLEPALRINAKKVVKRRGGTDSSNLFCIQWLQFFEIVIDRRCVEFIKEIEKYTWDEINGKKIAKPKDGDDHYIQAMFYALNDVMEQVKPLEVI